MKLSKLLAPGIRRVRIRPTPRWAVSGPGYGPRLVEADHVWTAEPIGGGKLRLRNLSTDHAPDLGADQVREFLSSPEHGVDGFLRLKSLLILDGRMVRVEPLW
jgi:hypothetical protein